MAAYDLVNKIQDTLPLFGDREDVLDVFGEAKYNGKGAKVTRPVLGEGMGIHEFSMWRMIAMVEKGDIIALIEAGEIPDDTSAQALDARCWAGIEWLSHYAGISRSEGYRAITTLTMLGYLDPPVKRKKRHNVIHYRRVNKQRLEEMLNMLQASKAAFEASSETDDEPRFEGYDAEQQEAA